MVGGGASALVARIVSILALKKVANCVTVKFSYCQLLTGPDYDLFLLLSISEIASGLCVAK